MSKVFEVREFEENAFCGMEVQVCGETKTVQFAAWDHGDPKNTPSPALPLDKAREMLVWLEDAIAKAEHA
jgi:hypothetical protein